LFYDPLSGKKENLSERSILDKRCTFHSKSSVDGTSGLPRKLGATTSNGSRDCLDRKKATRRTIRIQTSITELVYGMGKDTEKDLVAMLSLDQIIHQLILSRRG
jgi:hypothetical protein